jgi:hypothetical protein
MEASALAVGAVAWVAILARMMFDFFGTRPRPTARLLQGCGLLLIMTVLLVVFSAEVGGWTHDQYRIAHIVVLPLALTGLVIVVVGQVKRDRPNRTQRHLPGRTPVPGGSGGLPSARPFMIFAAEHATGCSRQHRPSGAELSDNRHRQR